ncbi:MAG TPA: hypothetical protein VIG99_24560 [Myxococcaceae bacterium]|jgi:hypothetical protein
MQMNAATITYLEIVDDTATSRVDRDHSMERHLKAIAGWCLLLGGLLALGALCAVGVAVARVGLARPGEQAPVIVLGLIGGVWFMTGYFLRRFSGIARTITLVVNASLLVLSLLGVIPMLIEGEHTPLQVLAGLISILWCVAVAWATGSERAEELCATYYRRAALAEPGPSGWASPFFWGPFAAALLFWCVSPGPGHRVPMEQAPLQLTIELVRRPSGRAA